MDQFDIYVNVDSPSDNRSRRNHWENDGKIQEPKRIGPALSDMQKGAETVKKSSCRAAAVCLGLLGLLLLTGLIMLVFLYIKGKTEMNLLRNSYNNLTDERDQLQTGYNNLVKERDQLQTGYNNLVKERDQLQTGNSNLTKERDQLQKRFENVTKERNYLETKFVKGWESFQGSFYHISSLAKTWQESRDDCLEKGADLVIINSREEQEFTRSFKKRVWIGLTDQGTEGTWKWVDGTLLTTRYWADNEPNGAGRYEDCAEINKYDLQNNWNDEPCNLRKSWICERASPP